MQPSRFVERTDDYEEVLEALRTLPDEKISSNRVNDRVGEVEYNVNQCIQDLIRLGEVELCQERGTGGRIWLKRRSTPEGTRERQAMATRGWQCYVTEAEDFRRRIADRLFTTREAAMVHLGDSAVVDPTEYEVVPFLEDVWANQTSGAEGYKEMIAVVRSATIYQTPDAAERLDRLG